MKTFMLYSVIIYYLFNLIFIKLINLFYLFLMTISLLKLRLFKQIYMYIDHMNNLIKYFKCNIIYNILIK